MHSKKVSFIFMPEKNIGLINFMPIFKTLVFDF